MSDRLKFFLLFAAFYVFRCYFGFSQPLFSTDELQTYLIGLKFYCGGGWPYFGPDLIVTETGFYTQIPGALEALLIGLPFYLLPIPEAPFLLLNFLSLSALAFLSKYISLRVTRIPLWFIFSWICFLPWTLFESTHMNNLCYVLFGGVLFFIGFMEAMPSLSLGWIRVPRAFGLMGFGLFWCMQFHFSWVLLPPFVAIAFWARRGKGEGLLSGGAFLLGALPPVLLLIPTLLQFGWSKVLGGGGTTQWFPLSNILAFFTILLRYFSLACHETIRFLGINHEERQAFYRNALWLDPPAFFLIVAGWVQVALLLAHGWMLRRGNEKPVVSLVFGGFLLVYASFWFTSKEPLAHIYYVLMPVVLVYSFVVWNRLAGKKLWKTLGILCLAASFWLDTGILTRHLNSFPALYGNRDLAAKAVTEKNYHLLGERRPGSAN
ncbi:MAG TPA: hypothetical protein VMV05_05250 [bacterium]|nr:hypothetical protein [bacterium]